MKKINILCAKSWGRLGNFNSAKLVARHFRNLIPNGDTKIIPLEDIWPEFEAWGWEMQEACSLRTPDLIKIRFQEIYDRIDRAIDCGEGFPDRVLEIVRDDIISVADVAIGMKGLASRLLCKARATAHAKPFVANWVTNSGLLDIDLHRCPEADIHFVPFALDADKIARHWGVDRARLALVGPPISLAHARSGLVSAPESEGPIIIAYFHLLTFEAAEAMYSIAAQNSSALLNILYAVADDTALNLVGRLAEKFPDRIFHSRAKAHEEFLGLLHRAQGATSKILIAKSGPNTMFEAISLGLPVLMFRSGLPQEEWVGRFIQDNQVGLYVGDVESIVGQVPAMLESDAQDTYLANQQDILLSIHNIRKNVESNIVRELGVLF